MVRLISLSVVSLFLAACHAGSPYFSGISAKRVQIEGMVFEVRVRSDLAEANRISPQFVPRFHEIAVQAARAMRVASGCDVIEVRGDAAQIVGVLACNPDRSTHVPTGAEFYDCVVIDRVTGDPDVVLIEDYECNIVPI
jgi:hypothetical protein